MTEPVSQNGFLCVTDILGIRHAIRLNVICGIRDTDIDRLEAVIVVNGGRDSITVPYGLERIFDALDGRRP